MTGGEGPVLAFFWWRPIAASYFEAALVALILWVVA